MAIVAIAHQKCISIMPTAATANFVEARVMATVERARKSNIGMDLERVVGTVGVQPSDIVVVALPISTNIRARGHLSCCFAESVEMLVFTKLHDWNGNK
jgi:hypothetical protein